MSMLAERLERLKINTAGAEQAGVWDLSPYNHGFANGMRVALALMVGSEPQYLKLAEGADYAGGASSKAVVSRAVKIQPPSPATVEPDYEPATDAPMSTGRGIGALISDVHDKLADRGLAKKEPTSAPAPAKAEEIPMAKKTKPAPKKPAAKVSAKAKPVAKAKAKPTRKASTRKAASFKGPLKRGKGRGGKTRKTRA